MPTQKTTFQTHLHSVRESLGQQCSAPYQHIHVIVNPAAGRDQPILNTLNTVFGAAGVAWEVYVTKKKGDATCFAQKAVATGANVVAAYGGDGTLMEVMRALAGGRTPLAILPGGTGNGVATELGIPKDLWQAATLLCGFPHTTKRIDVGVVQDQPFALRASIGFTAAAGTQTPRALKDRYGKLAYLFSALQHGQMLATARYRLTLDGHMEEVDGIFCTVLNVKNIGLGQLSLAPNILLNDGLLDIFVLTDTGLSEALPLAAELLTGVEDTGSLLHWQASEILIEADPPQPVSLDGERIAPTPTHIRIHPRAIEVVVPAVETVSLLEELRQRLVGSGWLQAIPIPSTR